MSEKRFIIKKCSSGDSDIYDNLKKDYFIGDSSLPVNSYAEEIVDLLNELYGGMKRFGEHNYKLEQYNLHYLNENTRLKEENKQLRQMIKENVFQRYREGSLADLEFKAIAYDDIVKVEMPNELEPRVIVYCKQGKKENIMSYCQMVIPFGVPFEIKEIDLY